MLCRFSCLNADQFLPSSFKEMLCRFLDAMAQLLKSTTFYCYWREKVPSCEDWSSPWWVCSDKKGDGRILNKLRGIFLLIAQVNLLNVVYGKTLLHMWVVQMFQSFILNYYLFLIYLIRNWAKNRSTYLRKTSNMTLRNDLREDDYIK